MYREYYKGAFRHGISLRMLNSIRDIELNTSSWLAIFKHTLKIITTPTVLLRPHFTTNSLPICYRDILSVRVVLSSVINIQNSPYCFNCSCWFLSFFFIWNNLFQQNIYSGIEIMIRDAYKYLMKSHSVLHS